MSLFSSLTNRIFVASALLAVVSIAIGIYNVNTAVAAQAEQELLRGLYEARTLIDENRRSQVEQFKTIARLIADLPRLKALVGEDDANNTGKVVEEYQQGGSGPTSSSSPTGTAACWPGCPKGK